MQGNARDKIALLNIQRIKLLPTETRHNLFFPELSTLLKTRDKIVLGVVEYKNKIFLLNIHRIKLLPTAETRHNLFSLSIPHC
jgi:hypothetical protein